MRTYLVYFKMVKDMGMGRAVCRGSIEYNAREWDAYGAQEQCNALLEYAKDIATHRFPTVDWTGADFHVEDCGYRGHDTIGELLGTDTGPTEVVHLGEFVSQEDLDDGAITAPLVDAVLTEGMAAALEEVTSWVRTPPVDDEWGPNPYALPVLELPDLDLKGELAALVEDFTFLSARIARIQALMVADMETPPAEEANRGAGGAV